MENWQKLLVAAGGAVGVAGCLYFLLQEETDADLAMLSGAGAQDADGSSAEQQDGVTKNEIVEILKEMADSQEIMQKKTRSIAVEFAANPDMKFEDLCKKVTDAAPEDPLEKRGLPASAFEQLLQACLQDPQIQNDPAVQQVLGRLMGQPAAKEPSAKAKEITSDLVVEMHTFMLEELEKFKANLTSLPNQSSADKKTIILAAQVVMDGKRLAKYGVSSEDMDAAIMVNQAKLSSDEAFMQVAMKFQKAMQGLSEGA